VLSLTFFANNNIHWLMNPRIIPHHNVAHLNYIWEWSIHYSSLSAMLTPLHSSMNQEMFKKYPCNQGDHYENTDDFHYTKEAITCDHQNILPHLAISWTTMVVHSRDDQGVGVAHEIKSPKNQPQFLVGAVLVR